MRPQYRSHRSPASRTASDSRTKCWRNPGSRAFTLVEVLVALVVLSIGIVVALSAFQGLLVALAEARDTLRADLLIKEKFAETETSLREQPGATPVAARGRFPGTQQADFLWEMSVGEMSGPWSEHRESKVYRFTLSVWREGSAVRHTVTTCMSSVPAATGKETRS